MRRTPRRDRTDRPDRSPLMLIFLTVVLDLIGFGIILPVLPLFAREATGNNEVMIGILMASYSAMQFLFVPVLGRLSDRVGRKPVLLASVLGSCFSYLLMAYALHPSVHSLPLLFLSRILDGISGANLAAAQAYVADVTTPENRSKGMGMIGAAFGIGFIIGPMMGGLLTHHFGASSPALAAAALAMANAFGIWRALPESLKEKGSAAGARFAPQNLFAEVARRREIALPVLVFFLAQFAAAVSQVAFPLFMSDPDLAWRLDERSIGYLFAYIGVVVAVIQGGLIGRLVKRLGETRVAWTGIAVLAASYFLFPYVATRPGLYAILAAMAFGQGATIPALNGLVSRRSGAGEQGSVLGVTMSMASRARVLGPLWAGWAYGMAPGTAYTSAAAVLVLALVLSFGFGKN